MSISDKLANVIPLLNERGGFAQGTDLILYEEVKPKRVEQIEDYDQPPEKVLDDLMDGDIIVFQKDEPVFKHYDLPSQGLL